jgi:hypothetical protein
MTLLVRQDLDAAATDAPTLADAERPGPDALRALSLDAPKAVYSTVVLAGLVTAAEWLAIAAAGVIPYAAHVVPNVGPQPLYFAIIGLAATLATVPGRRVPSNGGGLDSPRARLHRGGGTPAAYRDAGRERCDVVLISLFFSSARISPEARIRDTETPGSSSIAVLIGVD